MTRKLISRIIPLLLILAVPPAMLYTIWINPTSAAEDDCVYTYPIRKMVGQSLREGRWPVFNPLEAGGSPLLADPQASVMFPPTWMMAAGPAKLAFALNIFLAFSMAGAGAYLYLRRLGLARPASTFGAMAFMFCGFMVGHRVHLPMIQTAGFFPWGLWAIELLPAAPFVGFAILVPVFALAIVAGHWAILANMTLAWTVYILLRRRSIVRSLLVMAFAGVLAAAIAFPQIYATFSLMDHATRKSIGYATLGENSFFPASAILALFPMIMGSQVPDFFPQRWWGTWHLSEMLGYVGLVTLVLAGAAVWTLYRKKAKSGRTAEGDRPPLLVSRDSWTPLVRTWTWLAIGAGVWMLGYYLPTYKLIQYVPVFNVVRCPARMLLVVDMALASLAAVAVHKIVVSGDERAARLMRAIRKGVTLVLPMTMVAAIALLAIIAAAVMVYLRTIAIPFVGTAQDALAASRPANPAVWVQFVLLVATILAVRSWLEAPKKLAPLLVVMLLADLFFITRFVDVPASVKAGPDPDVSPAAQWLHENAAAEKYVVFGLSKDYRDRPNELLQPKIGQSLGVATLGSYGAWHWQVHAHMFGFNTYGRCRDWAWLIRRNHLLSLYNVRYVVAADRKFRDVIESVRIDDAPRHDGPNLLSDRWRLDFAEQAGGTVRLCTPFMWRWSQAAQDVAVIGGKVYRISLDARGPEGGAANFLRAEIVPNRDCAQCEDLGLTVIDERIATDWRHFTWTFAMPEGVTGEAVFRIFTISERPIEVRNVQLRESRWETPINIGGRLKPGEAVYRKVAEVPAVFTGDEPVAIYENMLCQGPMTRPGPAPSNESIERLRWAADAAEVEALGPPPDVSLDIPTPVNRLLATVSLPAVAVYLAALAAGFLLRRRIK